MGALRKASRFKEPWGWKAEGPCLFKELRLHLIGLDESKRECGDLMFLFFFFEVWKWAGMGEIRVTGTNLN
jgi:hypothetical protein